MRFQWLLMMAAGCSDKADSGTSSLYEYIGDCDDGLAPVVSDLYCESSGIQLYPPTGEEVPTMTVWADVVDEDGDLTDYIAQLFFDPNIDGSIDTGYSALPAAEGFYHADVCTVPSIILGMTVYLRGGEPLYDTTYEWGLQVTDAAGVASNIAMVECTTPAAPEGDTK